MLWSWSDDKSTWPKGVTRATVLGKWHELKLELWNEMQAVRRMPGRRRARANERW